MSASAADDWMSASSLRPSAASDVAASLMKLDDGESAAVTQSTAAPAESNNDASPPLDSPLLSSKLTAGDHLQRVLQRVNKQNAFLQQVQKEQEEKQQNEQEEETQMEAEAARIAHVRDQHRNEVDLLSKVTQWSLWLRCDQPHRLPVQARMSFSDAASDILQMGRGRLRVVLKSLFSDDDVQRSRALLCLAATCVWADDDDEQEQQQEEEKEDIASSSRRQGYSYFLLVRDFALSLLPSLCRSHDDIVLQQVALTLQMLVSNTQQLPLMLTLLPQIESCCFYISLHVKNASIRLHALTAAQHLTHFSTALQSSPQLGAVEPSLSHSLRNIDAPLFHAPADGSPAHDVDSPEFGSQLDELVFRITERVVAGSMRDASADQSLQQQLPSVEEEDSEVAPPVQLLPVAVVQLLLELLLGPDQSLQSRTRNAGVIDVVEPIQPEQTLLFEAETLLHSRLTQLSTLEKLTSLQQKGKMSRAKKKNAAPSVENEAPDDSESEESILLTPPLRCALVALQVLTNLAALPQHQPVLLSCPTLLPTIVALAQFPLTHSSAAAAAGADSTAASNSSAPSTARPYSFAGRLLLQCLAHFSLNPLSHSHLLRADHCAPMMMQYLSAGAAFFQLSPFVYALWQRDAMANDDPELNPYSLVTQSPQPKHDKRSLRQAAHSISHHSSSSSPSLVFGLDPEPDPRIFSILAASFLSNLIGMAPAKIAVDELVRLLKPEKGVLPSAALSSELLPGHDSSVLSSFLYSSAFQQSLQVNSGLEALLECLAEGCTKVPESSSRFLLMALVRLSSRTSFRIEHDVSLRLLDALLQLMLRSEQLDQKHYALVTLTNVLTHMPADTSDTAPIHTCSHKLLHAYFDLLELDDPGVKMLSLASIDRLLQLPSARGVLLRMQHGGVEAVCTLLAQAEHPDLTVQVSTLCALATLMQQAKNEGGLLAELLHKTLAVLLPVLLKLSLSSHVILHLHASRLFLCCFDNAHPDVHALLAMGDGVLMLLFRLLSSNADWPLKLRALTLSRCISAHAVYQPALVRTGIAAYCCKWILDSWEGSAHEAQVRQAPSLQIPAQISMEEYEKVLLFPSILSLRRTLFDDWSGSQPKIVVHPLLEMALLFRNICTSVAPALAVATSEHSALAAATAAAAAATAAAASKEKPKSKKAKGSSVKLKRGKSAAAPSKGRAKKASASPAAAAAAAPDLPLLQPSPLALEVFRLLLDSRALDACLRLTKETHAPETNRMALQAIAALLPFAAEQFRTAQSHLPNRRTLMHSTLALLQVSTTPLSVSTPLEVAALLHILLDLIVSEQSVASWVQADGWNVLFQLWRPSVPVAKGDGVQLELMQLLLRVSSVSSSHFHLPLEANHLNLLLSLASMDLSSAKAGGGVTVLDVSLQRCALQLLVALANDDSFRLPLCRLGAMPLLLSLRTRRDRLLRETASECLCYILHNDAILLVENENIDLVEVLLPMSQSHTNQRLKNLAANCLVRLALYADEVKVAAIKRGANVVHTANATIHTAIPLSVSRKGSASRIPLLSTHATPIRPPSSSVAKKSTPFVNLAPVNVTPLPPPASTSSSASSSLLSPARPSSNRSSTPNLGGAPDRSLPEPQLTPTAVAPSVHRSLLFSPASAVSDAKKDNEVPRTAVRASAIDSSGSAYAVQSLSSPSANNSNVNKTPSSSSTANSNSRMFQTAFNADEEKKYETSTKDEDLYEDDDFSTF